MKYSRCLLLFSVIFLLTKCAPSTDKVSFTYDNTDELNSLSEKFSVETPEVILESQMEVLKANKLINEEFNLDDLSYIALTLQKQNRDIESVTSSEIPSLLSSHCL